MVWNRVPKWEDLGGRYTKENRTPGQLLKAEKRKKETKQSKTKITNMRNQYNTG